MGDWDYYCILCGAPFFVRRARKVSEVRLPTFNRSRHLWLGRFRLLGRNKKYPKAKKCFLTGHATHDSFGTAICAYNSDPAAAVPETSIGGDFSAYSSWEPWSHAIHDACIMLFAEAVKLKQTEETGPFPGSPRLDKDALYDMLLESQTIRKSYFGLGIELYEMKDAARFQYWNTTADISPFILDPLHIPEIEKLVQDPPLLFQPRESQSPFTRLPAEITKLILVYLNAEEQAKAAASLLFPPAFFVPWREKLILEMPYVFEFKSFDWGTQLVNWPRVYRICARDTDELRQSVREDKYNGVLRQPIPDIDPKIATTARDVFVTCVDPSAAGYNAEQDVKEDGLISNRNKYWTWQDSIDDDPEYPYSESEKLLQNIEKSPGFKPIIPGLANRQRIWNTLQPLVDRYLAKVTAQRVRTSWLEGNSVHLESVCFGYPLVADSVNEDNRVDTVMFLDDLDLLRNTLVEVQLCYNDDQVVTGMLFKVSVNGRETARPFGYVSGPKSDKAYFALAELDSISLTLRGIDDESRAIKPVVGVTGIEFRLKNGRTVPCGDQVGAKRYFLSREGSVITGLTGYRDTRFLETHKPANEQFLNLGVTRHSLNSNEKLRCNTEIIEELLWKDVFPEDSDLMLRPPTRVLDTFLEREKYLCPAEVLSFENGSLTSSDIVRFGARFAPATTFVQSGSGQDKSQAIPVWVKENDSNVSWPQAIFIEYSDGSRIHVGRIRDPDISHCIDIDGAGGERISKFESVRIPRAGLCCKMVTNRRRFLHFGGCLPSWPFGTEGIRDSKRLRANENRIAIKGLLASWTHGKYTSPAARWPFDNDRKLNMIHVYGQKLGS